MMLVLVLSSLLRPPDIVGAGQRLLSSNDRQSDITRYLLPYQACLTVDLHYNNGPMKFDG